MKKTWNKPELAIELFAPNQRIATNCRTNVNQYTSVNVTWHCGRKDGTSDDNKQSAHNAYINELNNMDIFYSSAAGCNTQVSSFEELSSLVYNRFGYEYVIPSKGSRQDGVTVFCKEGNSEHVLRLEDFNVYDEIINS